MRYKPLMIHLVLDVHNDVHGCWETWADETFYWTPYDSLRRTLKGLLNVETHRVLRSFYPVLSRALQTTDIVRVEYLHPESLRFSCTVEEPAYHPSEGLLQLHRHAPPVPVA